MQGVEGFQEEEAADGGGFWQESRPVEDQKKKNLSVFQGLGKTVQVEYGRIV